MIKRNVKKIIAILILIVMFFPHISCLAISQEKAGEYIASYAYDFCTRFGENSGNNQTIYDYKEGNPPYCFYLGERSTGGVAVNKHHHSTSYSSKIPSKAVEKSYSNLYAFECSCFVQSMIHQSLSIGTEDYSCMVWDHDTTYFSRVTDEKRPGDVIQTGGHVIIYLGEKYGSANLIANGTQNNVTLRGAVAEDYSNASLSKTRFRIREDIAEKIDENDCKATFDGGSLISNGMTINESEFYYNGIPNGYYSVTAGIEEWIVDFLKDLLDYVIGIITLSQRMIFVGWAAIIENLITNTIINIDDTTDNDTNGGQHPTSLDVNDRAITIESIIFNTVDLLDVNFFKVEDTSAPETTPTT